ncbi:MAG TPA: hypothetical protein VHZ99_02775 [Steroidobacteraceae bacterium]|jgi:mannose-6-phosphate isomerase-like protein (cupin superfamily)|nr:hypothetical protein [Steroidobacteraceae bacterium]
MQSDEQEGIGAARRFGIYRRADARDYGEHNIQSMDDVTPVMAQGLRNYASEDGSGQDVKLLYAAPGFSLTYVWFKSGYPLPLHSHSNDCLYYIVAGTLTIGREVLGAGDGFFVAKDVAYTYEPGPEGVEVLEFRKTHRLNIRFRSDDKAVWDQAAAVLAAHATSWAAELPPSAAISASPAPASVPPVSRR